MFLKLFSSGNYFVRMDHWASLNSKSVGIIKIRLQINVNLLSLRNIEVLAWGRGSALAFEQVLVPKIFSLFVFLFVKRNLQEFFWAFIAFDSISQLLLCLTFKMHAPNVLFQSALFFLIGKFLSPLRLEPKTFHKPSPSLYHLS